MNTPSRILALAFLFELCGTLLSTDSLSPANWVNGLGGTNNTGYNTRSVPTTLLARFYRLAKP